MVRARCLFRNEVAENKFPAEYKNAIFIAEHVIDY
jgi:hypothetical protein